MSRSTKMFLPVLVLGLGILACASPVPVVPTLDMNDLETVVASTVIDALTQSAVPGAPLISETPTFTSTPETPAFTPTSTNTPTPIFTFTPPVPLISVSVATNCRNGPGKVYGYEGALLTGETAEVLARDPTGKYWYIRNPDSSGSSYCWVWGEYATLSGSYAFLPVYTPPPTPTPTFTPNPTLTPTPSPDFVAVYTSLDTCTGWWVEFKLKNTGSVSFRSVELAVNDLDTGVMLSNLTDGFTDTNGCLTSTTKNTLLAGNSVIVSAPAFTYNPAGHSMRAKFTVCSNPGLSGLCITKKIDFKP